MFVGVRQLVMTCYVMKSCGIQMCQVFAHSHSPIAVEALFLTSNQLLTVTADTWLSVQRGFQPVTSSVRTIVYNSTYSDDQASSNTVNISNGKPRPLIMVAEC